MVGVAADPFRRLISISKLLHLPPRHALFQNSFGFPCAAAAAAASEDICIIVVISQYFKSKRGLLRGGEKETNKDEEKALAWE